MKKEEKLELKASDYAISHYDGNKTYTSLEVHKMLCNAYIAGNNEQWKPSDEQMKTLKEACDEHWEPDGLDPLYTLYQDLKKLREE